jgi:hypothetical protein
MPRSPLAVPEHPQLAPEIRQAWVDLDRKLGVFIIPQLRELGQERAVEQLVARGAELAARASQGEHEALLSAYRALLQEAQAALREARSQEAAASQASGARRHEEAEAESAIQLARSRLPARRLARLEARLAELGEVDPKERRLAIAEAIEEWDRMAQTRDARLAERMAETAHLPVRPRQRETARSRKARRDQERILELARNFDPDRALGAPARAGQ